MFEQWIAQLQHSDPAKRREAIIALGKLADPRALPYLARCYEVEREPDLRDLIAKAGRRIQQVAAERKPAPITEAPKPPEMPPAPSPKDDVPQEVKITSPTPVQLRTPSAEPVAPVIEAPAKPAAMPSAPSPKDDDFPEPELFYPLPEEAPAPIKRAPQLPQKPVTERDRQRADEHLRSAYAYQTSGDSQRAVLMLARALQRNPELAQRRDVQGLAHALVGGDARNAIERVPEAAKRVRVNAPLISGEPFGIVLSAAALFLMIIVFNVALFYSGSTLGLLIGNVLFGTPFDTAEIQAGLGLLAFQVVVPSALQWTPLTVLSTVFNLMMVYWIGTLMGGTGSVVRFLSVMLSLYAVFFLLLSVGFGMMVVGVFNPSVASLIQFGPITLIGAGLLFIVGQVYLSARVQEFSFVNAIASVIAGNILTGIVVRVLQSFGVPV
jgi:outer membrane biosynthesis protein TonB